MALSNPEEKHKKSVGSSNNEKVVISEKFSLVQDETFKLELQVKPLSFICMFPTQWGGYQTMVEDGAVHTGQEVISQSGNDSVSTVGLEQARVVCASTGLENVSINNIDLEQLKVGIYKYKYVYVCYLIVVNPAASGWHA